MLFRTPLPRLLVFVASLALLHCGGGSGGSGGTTPSVQDAPTALTATLYQAPAIFHLAWTKPATAFDGYEFEGRQDSGAYTKLHQGLISNIWVEAYYDGGYSLPELSPYSFRVRVMRGTTPSAYSNESGVRIGLFAPTVYSPYAANGGITISWINNSLLADTLKLERGTPNGSTTSWSTLPNVPFGTTSWLDMNAQEGLACLYRVTYSKGQDSAQADSYNTATSPMVAPSQITATPLVEGVKLDWQNTSQVATEVAVMRSSGLNAYPSYQQVALVPVGTTTYQDTLLATGYYTYRLENRKTGVSPAYSEPVQVVTLPPQNGVSVVPTTLLLPQAGTIRRGSQGQWFLSGTYTSSVDVMEPSGANWVDYIPPSALSWSAPYFLLDSHDRPHLVYLRSVVQGSQEVALMHAWRDAVGWQTEEIARRMLSSDSTRSPYTFALDAQDRLHLVWLKSAGTTADLEYAFKDQSGTWAVEALGALPTQSTLGSYKLTLDPLGQPHVLVGAWTTLFHLTRSAGTWSTETIPSNGASVGWYEFLGGLASGPDSLIVMAPRAHQPYDGKYDLVMFRKEAGSWLPEEVIVTTTTWGFSGTLASNPGGTRFALYYGTDSGSMLRVWTSGVWSSSLVGPSSYGSPLLGFDASDKLYLLLSAGYGASSNSYTYVLYREQP